MPFLAERVLLPRMKEGIKGGFTAPPEETTFEVFNLQSVPTLAKMAKAA